MKVSEIIAELSKLDPDMTVVVNDADTGWALDAVTVGVGTAEGSREVLCVICGGGYSNNKRGYLA